MHGSRRVVWLVPFHLALRQPERGGLRGGQMPCSGEERSGGTLHCCMVTSSHWKLRVKPTVTRDIALPSILPAVADLRHGDSVPTSFSVPEPRSSTSTEGLGVGTGLIVALCAVPSRSLSAPFSPRSHLSATGPGFSSGKPHRQYPPCVFCSATRQA